MRTTFRAILVCVLLLGFCTTGAQAQVTLTSPSNGANLSSEPTFAWTGGDYDLYLFITVFYYDLGYWSDYYPVKFWLADTGFAMPSAWWDKVGEDAACYWAVLGYNTATHQWAVSSVFSFTRGNSPANMAVNGGFEEGSTEWIVGSGDTSAFDQWKQFNNVRWDSTLIQTQQGSSPVYAGSFSAHILGGQADNIYQYDEREAATYTVSARIYAVTGSGFVGIAWNTGAVGTYTESTITGQWEYVEHVETVPVGRGGPTAGTGDADSEVYIDCLWYNLGAVSSSPCAP